LQRKAKQKQSKRTEIMALSRKTVSSTQSNAASRTRWPNSSQHNLSACSLIDFKITCRGKAVWSSVPGRDQQSKTPRKKSLHTDTLIHWFPLLHD